MTELQLHLSYWCAEEPILWSVCNKWLLATNQWQQYTLYICNTCDSIYAYHDTHIVYTLFYLQSLA